MRLVVEDDTALSGATAEFERIIERVDRIASRFRGDSALSVANANAGRPVPIPRDLVLLVAAALEAAERTGGAVDPTVGQSVIRAGYDRDIAEVPADGAALELLPTGATWRDVLLDRQLGVLTVPVGVALDLGATAKSFTADLIARTVLRRFSTPVLVELGGDVAVAGTRPGGWPIMVAEREGGPGQLVTVRSGGVATSTTTIRRWKRGGRTMHHLIDPRTGRPTDGPWRTVSVAADSALAANTASTCAIVLGARAESVLTGQGLAARLVGSDGRIVTTPGWPRPLDTPWPVAS
jgi:thiamine biosynthesis lipoprotein